MDATKELENLLIKACADIADRKIKGKQIEAIYLPREYVNLLENGGYIEKPMFDDEQLLYIHGLLKAEKYPIMNYAKIVVHPYDDLIIFKKYGEKYPRVVKIIKTNEK